MKPPPDPHYRHRFSAEIISHAVWLYHVFSLSLRDVELLLAERGIVVSYETVRRWCQPVKIINDAVEQVRRAEQKTQSLLRGTRYIWLRNPQTLTDRQRVTLGGLPTRHLKTARAYQIRLAFQDLYDQPSVQAGASHLKKWYFWATHSRIEPVIDAPRTVKRHWDGILRWFDSKIANGLIEGINSLVQAAKAKARGYRSTRNLKAIIYLLAGKLDLRLPA